jgi:preprotein translocase subunit YajC
MRRASANPAPGYGRRREGRLPDGILRRLPNTALETQVLISPAYAQSPAATGEPGWMGFFPIILMFVLLYFVLIRPQMKRAKETKSMIEALQKGDEIITAGGVLGRITKMGDAYLAVEIAPNTEVQVQKSAVQTLLPKGTIKSI